MEQGERQVQEAPRPNAVVVKMKVMQVLLQYLDSRPRGEVNNLAIALEQSSPVHIKQDQAEAVAPPVQKPPVPPVKEEEELEKVVEE